MPYSSLSVRIATLGPLGRSPHAPGTVATFVAGIPAAGLLGLAPVWLAFLLTPLLIAGGCFVSSQAEKEMGKHDPREIVVDELLGCIVAAMGLPTSVKALLLAALLFRIFDIWKPWLIGAAERVFKGGAGIVMDDVLAGLAANALTRAVLYFWQ